MAVLATVLCCALGNISAHAANSTKSINVKLNVVSGCALNVTDMDFGSVTQVLGTETATSTVTVNCSPGVPFRLSFLPVFSRANTKKNSVLTDATGDHINFSMALKAWRGRTSRVTQINGKLMATPNAAEGIYKSVETLYVIY